MFIFFGEFLEVLILIVNYIGVCEEIVTPLLTPVMTSEKKSLWNLADELMLIDSAVAFHVKNKQ